MTVLIYSTLVILMYKLGYYDEEAVFLNGFAGLVLWVCHCIYHSYRNDK